MRTRTFAAIAVGGMFGCGPGGTAGVMAAAPVDPGDAAMPYADAAAGNGGSPLVDGGYVLGDGAVVRADRFITKLVDASYGPCSGFGQASLPGIIQGPPVGSGTSQGSLDVLSLGNGGSLVVSFEPNAIVDGPGVDFIVFENPFWIGGDPQHPYAEPGVVSVSEDGVTWKSFVPCTATNASPGGPYGSCAGWNPVYSAPANGISPFDSKVSGGEGFDLHDVALSRALYVKIVDQGFEECPTSGPRKDNNGFDLDAIAIVNAESP